MKAPMVSIVVPVYNAEKWINETIQSVLQQTFTDWEMILVNDGSKDNTLALLKEFEKRDQDKFKVINKKNSGVSDTRNIGIENASGKYIALLDADDYWLPDNLKRKVELLEANPEIGFVFSDMNYTDQFLQNPHLAPVGKDQNILEDLLLWNGEVIPGPCSNLVIRKACFDKGIRFNKKLTTIADQHLTVQLAFYFKGKRIPEPLWNYRLLPGSMSKSVRVMERDCNVTYEDYRRSGYFYSRRMELKALSKMYLIVAGSYWKDAGEKLRAIDYLIKSICCNPIMLFLLIGKIKGRG